jgi:poly-gamma-glutamate capsule biosynthesis protein CapA/YwtB (metallophosphatase superfamily)
VPKYLYIFYTLTVWCLATVISPPSAAGRNIVVTAVGDIMLAGSGSATFKRQGYDYPFAATAAELQKGDIAVGNLEAPIARRGTEFTDKRFRYRTSPRTATALRKAGFAVVTLANNHIMDFGPTALRETLAHLDKAGVAHTGAGDSLAAARQETVITIGEKRIAFLAYSFTFPTEFYATPNSPGTAPGYPLYYQEDIARARASSDHVIVSFHWGSEHATVPHPYQVAVARAAIDAGADAVIGHHPHVLQGIEWYKKGIIFYSLGNFAFGTASRSTDRSVIARVILGDGVNEVELVPINVFNKEVRFQPQVLAGKKGKAVIDYLNRLSADLGTVIINDEGRYLAGKLSEVQSLAQQ